MPVAHVHRITFKQRNCTVTVKQDKITHNEEGTSSKVSFVEIILHSWQFIIVTTHPQPDGLSCTVYRWLRQ